MKLTAAQTSKQLLEEGIAYLDARRHHEAHRVLKEAIRLSPADAELLCVLGHAQEQVGLLEEGRNSFVRAHKLAPKNALALRNLASAELNIGKPDIALKLANEAIALDPDNTDLAAILLLAATSSASVDAAALLAIHKRVASRYDAIVDAATPHAPKTFTTSSVIRIGYFSHHFYRFPLASFLPHVMALHDRQRFRIYAFAPHGTMDDISDQYVQSTDEFHDLSALDDAEAAQYIRALDIDILIDLSGLTITHRFGILAHRPARVQMSWLGYFSSCGCRAIDFHITDAFANPPGITEQFFSETLLRLPSTQYAYRPLVADIEVSASPVRQNGYVTFGWFSAPTKLNIESLSAYAKIVAAVPDSRITFFAVSRDLQKFIADVFSKHHIKRNRISFMPRAAPRDYFRALSTVDICLDSFPMTGGTTVCDALWMGTPVISMFSARGFGGASSSVLNNVGASECIAHDIDSLIKLTVALADNRLKLIDYRGLLREKMKASPLMNTQDVCSMLEKRFVEALKDV